jgi:toxin ParE1/3/4
MRTSASSSTTGTLADAHPLDGTSRHDLTEICDYIKEHKSQEAGRKVALQIYEALGTLARFPNLGRRGRKPDTRELVFQGLPYLAIYRIRGDVVEINRILHGAQRRP